MGYKDEDGKRRIGVKGEEKSGNKLFDFWET